MNPKSVQPFVVAVWLQRHLPDSANFNDKCSYKRILFKNIILYVFIAIQK